MALPTPASRPTSCAPSPQRRRLLLGIGATAAGLEACGGGGAVEALAAEAPVTASPAPSPAPAAPTPAPATAASGLPAATLWAARPTAASAAGQALLVSDVGLNGSLWFSNGSNWVTLNTPLTLAHRFSNAQMDGSMGANTDVFLDGFTIPAGVLGPTSALRITAAYSFPGSGIGNKAPQVKAYYGVGSYASSFTNLLDSRGQFTNQKSFVFYVALQNKNSVAVNQIRPNDYDLGVSTNAFAESTVDFSQAVTLGFGALNNASSADATDQQRLDWFTVEMI